MARKGTHAQRMPAATPPPAPAAVADGRVTVTFAHAHTHRGVPFGKGDTYRATPEECELLRRFGAIEVA